MTTIVANLEGMAADTRCSIEGSVFYHAPKIFRIGNSLFGTAGDGMMCLVMVEWLQTTGRSKHALYKHWTENTDRSACWLIELRSPGELYVWDGWGVPEKILDKRYAIGSGQMAALAAYDRGASLEEAVKAGTNLDQYSGSPIHVEMLKVTSQKKRKR
jgi:hypothetical protein